MKSFMGSKFVFHSSCRSFYGTIFLLFCLSISNLKAQIFTPVTEGVLATDAAISAGCAWGDYNNDGFMDLAVVNGGAISVHDTGQNNFLYRNNGDGTFTRFTTGSGSIATDAIESASASWADYDRDGDLDLFVAENSATAGNSLYANNNDGTFTKMTNSVIAGVHVASFGGSWADINNDGNVDLFVATLNFSKNLLFLNNGDGTFFQMTSGEIVDDSQGESVCGTWSDYDNDGDLDLFVTKRNFGNNSLLVNEGDTTFSKVTEGHIVNNVNSSNGSWGDYDNDGDLDLFVANRVPSGIQSANFLYTNNGDGSFTQVTEGQIVTDRDRSEASSWGDFNNDGHLDLFVVNSGAQLNELNILYLNNGDGTFSTGQTIPSNFTLSGASADYDNDGDLDIFLTNFDPDPNENNVLLQNNGNSNHWININCIGVTTNTPEIGTKVRIKATIDGSPVWQMREISSQTGASSQNSMRVHFGLGDAVVIDSAKIEWLSGAVDVYTNVTPDMFYRTHEGGSLDPVVTSVESDDDNLPRQFQLSQNYPNPFNPTTTIEYTLPARSDVTIKIYTILGQEVRTLVNQPDEAGSHQVDWDGSNAQGQLVSSGIYVYRIEAGPFVETKKMILMK